MALSEAISIFRRSELVLMTGWTFDQLNEQDTDELDDLETHLRIKGLIREERARIERDQANSQLRPLPRGWRH